MSDDPLSAGDPRVLGAGVMTETRPVGARWQIIRWLLLALTAAGLGVDAYVHWHLASRFDSLTGTGTPQISQGQLFRLEAVLALIALVLLLATRSRLAMVFALLVTAGGVGAVLLYGIVDVGNLGPLPDMYDPTWYAEKTVSAIAEGVAALGAAGLLLLPKR